MATNTQAHTGNCPACGDPNFYTAVVCTGCGSRLPWADVAAAANRQSKQPISSLPATAPTPPAALVVQAQAPSTQLAASAQPAAPAPAPATSPQTVAPINKSISCDCPVCGNQNVQKVSAISQSGTWTESSSWVENAKWQSNSTGATAGPIHSKNGDAFAFGVTGSHNVGAGTTSGFGTTSGSTTLAAMLAPPPRPVQETPTDSSGCAGFCGVILLIIFVFWQSHTLSDTVACLLAALPALGVWSTISQNQEAAKSAKDGYPELVATWERKMARWNRLFFCARCGHVYEPESGRCEPVARMKFLF